MAETLTLRMKAHPGAIGPLRKRIVQQVDSWVANQRLKDIELMVTELVTNSIRHASLEPVQEIQIVLERLPSVFRVEVHDAGPGFDPKQIDGRPDPSTPGGFGLFLVRQFSDRWGVSAESDFCVWFEVDLIHGNGMSGAA